MQPRLEAPVRAGRILTATLVTLLAGSAVLLGGCASEGSSVSTGKIIGVESDGAGAQLTVVEVTRGDESPHEDATDSADYLNITFRVDNSESDEPLSLEPPNFAILFNTTPLEADASNPDVVVEAGETTKFTYTFVLGSNGAVEGIDSGDDVELFYARSAVSLPGEAQTARDVQDIRKSADEHGMLSEYWEGSLSR
jgi:hypothetical protein